MISLIAGAVANIILGPIMIFGYRGCPALDIRGAAIATVIGQWVGAAVALLLNRFHNPDVQVSFRGFKLEGSTVAAICKVGAPTIVMQAMGSVMNFGINGMLENATAVAFFGAYNKLQNFLFIPMNGLGQACLPIVGFNYGAKQGGRIRESGSELAVRFDAEYRSVDEIGSLQVAGADGARRYLRDLGTVRLATEEPRQRAFLNGEPGVTVKVVKKSDGNTVDTVRELRRRVAELRRELPPGAELLWLQDDAEIVQANVDNTVADIGSSILLCAVILFAFLVNLRSTFVVAVTMPVTILISLFFMQLAGLTLNLSTLLAMGLSAGILVSNSIVVLESIVRRFSAAGGGRADRWAAARDGASEQTVAILASAGTNVVVMLPIAMMSSLMIPAPQLRLSASFSAMMKSIPYRATRR